MGWLRLTRLSASLRLRCRSGKDGAAHFRDSYDAHAPQEISALDVYAWVFRHESRSALRRVGVTRMGLSFPIPSLIDDLASRKKMLTLQELADVTSVSYKTLWQMAQAGEIPHVRIGAQIRLVPSEISSWLNSHHVG